MGLVRAEGLRACKFQSSARGWGFWAVERFAAAPRPKKTQETQAETSLRP